MRKLALSFEPFDKLWVELRNLGFVTATAPGKKKKINMLSAFLLGFITLPILGEPELRRGVNSTG